jgi:hypothetical protein
MGRHRVFIPVAAEAKTAEIGGKYGEAEEWDGILHNVTEV